MTLEDFKDLPEWQKICAWLQQQIINANEQIDLAKDFPSVRECVGRKQAMFDVFNLPDNLFVKEKKDAEPSEKVLELPNRPNFSRNTGV